MKWSIDTIQTNYYRADGVLFGDLNDGGAITGIIKLPLECNFIEEIGILPVYNEENVLTPNKFISLTLNDTIHILDEVVIGSNESRLFCLKNLMKKVNVPTTENSFIRVATLTITDDIKSNSSIKVIIKWR